MEKEMVIKLAENQKWHTGDPEWKNGKGKGHVGTANYLASKGMNSVYFVTMNIKGDGRMSGTIETLMILLALMSADSTNGKLCLITWSLKGSCCRWFCRKPKMKRCLTARKPALYCDCTCKK